MLSTGLKRFVGILVVGGALSLTLLVVLPRIAEAQDEDWASTGTKQSTAYEKASAPAMSGPATDPPARLVAKPGASLWSIAQERLGPGALPEQVAAETERIFELNRDRIGGNASLILPGQELLVTPVAGPSAAPDPAMAKPAVVELPSEPADDRPVVLAGSPEGEAMPAANSVEGLSVVGNFKEFDEETELERRLLGFGALALTLILVIVGAWRLPMRRNVEDPADWGIPTGYYYHANYTLPRAPKDAVDASDPGSGLPGARTLALAVSSGPGDEDSANGHDYIPDRSIEAKDPGSGRDDPGGQGTNGGPVTASPYPGDRRPKAHRHRSYSKGS